MQQTLSPDDIALGRAALTRGWISRPQLDSAVAALREGRTPDLAGALVQAGYLTPQQVQQLRGAGAPAPASPPPATPPAGDDDEAPTLHDMVRPGAASPVPFGGPSAGAGFDPTGPSFGRPAPPRPTGGYPGFGGPSAPAPFDPGGVTQGPGQLMSPGSSSFPGGPAPSPPQGGFGSPSGSRFGPPAGPSGSAFGAPAGGFGAPSGSTFGAPPGGGAFGPSGSAFGPPPAAGGFNPAGSGFGRPAAQPAGGFSPQGSAFGPPGGGGFGAGSAFGAGPAAYGAPPSGSTFGAGPGAAPSAADGDVAEDERIGEWIVDRELARGGMGVVYLAHRASAEKAAIKVMLQANGSVSERKVKRFLREIESTAKLDHEYIVKILDSGEFRGYPYFAMEYVEGKPLDRMLKDDLDLEIGMEILEKMARAVHHAHEQGIIHRDLKPANVMVREDMVPKLTDFGLAKDKDHQSVLTKTGAVLGTPYYLSPEQASGRSKEIDRRADIYSLGVIMYELATGRLPFVGQTTVELYNRIIHDEPIPPSKIKPQLTKALENVCLKAMAKDPDDRYPTAAAFADDVLALLGGGRVSAKADGAAMKWLKRVRKRGSIPVVLAVTGGLLALVIGALAYVYKSNQDRLHQQQVQGELATIENATTSTLESARAQLAEGRAALRAGRVPDALEAARRVVTAVSELEARYGKLDHPAENETPVAALQERTGEARALLHADGLILQARATMRRDEDGALDEAQQALMRVLGEGETEGISPDNPYALTALGELLTLRGQLGDAEQQLAKALEALPGLVQARLARARVLMLQESFAEAAADLGATLDVLERPPAPEGGEQAPRFELEPIPEDERGELAGEILAERARARLALGETDKALEDARAADAKLAGGWRAKVVLGQVLAALGRAFEAQDALDQAVKAAPQLAGPRIARAELLLALRDPEAAWADANTAVSLDPGSLLALVVRAEAEEERLRFPQARRDAESVELQAQSQPRHWRVRARALRVRARIEGTVGNVAEAHQHAKSARAADAWSGDGALLLARLELDPYFEGQYYDDAENLLKEVQGQRPMSVAAKRGLGLVMLQKYASQPDRALRKFEEALALDPRDPWTLAAVARVYEVKAKKETAQADRFAEAAKRHWEKAGRYERDVRRPEGLIYAQALEAEQRARASTIKERPALIEAAQLAYRRAAWLVPTHAHAHTGLASLALLQNAHSRAGSHLARAAEANPESILTAVMNAFHLTSFDGIRENADQAHEALRKAIALRGPTVDLRLREVWLQTLQPDASDTQRTVGEKLAAVTSAFAELRKLDPLDVRLLEAEEELLRRLEELSRADPEVDVVRQRARTVGSERAALAAELAQRAERATALRAEARAKLEEDVLSAYELAYEAARLTPRDADAWLLVAQTREESEDLWGTLAAGIRAAYLDDAHLANLFRLLKRAGTEAKDEDKDKVAEYLVGVDREVLPFPADLAKLLQAAPLVARALVVDIDQQEAKQLFDELEMLLNQNPTRLLSHLMLGALAYGVRRDEYALQHLLFVGETRDDLGEAFYRAAVAAARSRSKSHELDVLAIRSLQRARAAGFDWTELASKEKGFDDLRASGLWKRLE